MLEGCITPIADTTPYNLAEIVLYTPKESNLTKRKLTLKEGKKKKKQTVKVNVSL